jgi:excisionase family DNA binding protein
MTTRQLKAWLSEQLKLAEPLESPSEMADPQAVAIIASKKLGLLGYGSGELLTRAGMVQTPFDCAAVLVDCLARLPESTAPSSNSERVLADQPSPEFLTVKQAAKKFNLGERTVYRMVEDGLPVTCAGRAVRIKPRDLAKWLADSETILR